MARDSWADFFGMPVDLFDFGMGGSFPLFGFVAPAKAHLKEGARGHLCQDLPMLNHPLVSLLVS